MLAAIFADPKRVHVTGIRGDEDPSAGDRRHREMRPVADRVATRPQLASGGRVERIERGSSTLMPALTLPLVENAAARAPVDIGDEVDCCLGRVFTGCYGEHDSVGDR